MKSKPQPKRTRKPAGKHDFWLFGVPDDIAAMLPKPYARNPSRVQWIFEAIREKAEREQKKASE